MASPDTPRDAGNNGDLGLGIRDSRVNSDNLPISDNWTTDGISAWDRWIGDEIGAITNPRTKKLWKGLFEEYADAQKMTAQELFLERMNTYRNEHPGIATTSEQRVTRYILSIKDSYAPKTIQ